MTVYLVQQTYLVEVLVDAESYDEAQEIAESDVQFFARPDPESDGAIIELFSDFFETISLDGPLLFEAEPVIEEKVN